MAVAAQQYTGDVAVLTPDAATNDTRYFPSCRQAMAKSTDYAVAGIGISASASDTITAQTGTLRRSSVGASGGAAVALVDQTESGVANLLLEVKLNNSREFVAMPGGLQATSTDFPFLDYSG